MTTARMTREPRGENLPREADRINRADPRERPGMAMKLVEKLRRDLREMKTVRLCEGTAWEQRAIRLYFHDGSCARMHQRDGAVMASPDSDPARRVTLTGPDGNPITIRGLMDNLQPRVTTAKKVIEAHLGPGPHNPLDQNGLESAAHEADRHALYVMHRLPLEYRDHFQHLGKVPGRSPHTALMPDGSRVAWIRLAGYGKEPRWQNPLAVAAIPPDPRWMREELELRGDCGNCGGPALEDVNARHVRTDAYGLEVDEMFCLVCLGEEREFEE